MNRRQLISAFLGLISNLLPVASWQHATRSELSLSASKSFQGFVPDAKTACGVAQAILGPIASEGEMKTMTYRATGHRGIWTVVAEQRREKEIVNDGAYVIRIQKSDCKVLEVRLA